MTLFLSISGSLCRRIVYRKEKHIFYSTLTYFFNYILSILASYSLYLAFIFSFLFSQKAEPYEKTDFCVLVLLFS